MSMNLGLGSCCKGWDFRDSNISIMPELDAQNTVGAANHSVARVCSRATEVKPHQSAIFLFLTDSYGPELLDAVLKSLLLHEEFLWQAIFERVEQLFMAFELLLPEVDINLDQLVEVFLAD